MLGHIFPRGLPVVNHSLLFSSVHFYFGFVVLVARSFVYHQVVGAGCYTMASFLLHSLALVGSATLVLASCGYNTHIHPREEGIVEVNTFGYSGTIVSHHQGLPLSITVAPFQSTRGRWEGSLPIPQLTRLEPSRVR